VSPRVDELPRVALRRLMPSLRRAQKELEAGLAQWLKTAPDASERFTALQYRSALRQIRAAMRAIGALEPALRTVLERGSMEAAALSSSSLTREIARLANVFGGELPRMDLPTAARLLERNGWLIRRYKESARRYSEEAQTRIRSHLSVGVLKNESIGQMAERIKGLVPVAEQRAGASMAQSMADGLSRNQYFAAERLVRTEMMEAYNAHHEDGLRDWASDTPGAMKRWNAARDRHCVLCASLNGQIRKVDEEFDGGYMHPPRHPYCRCVVIPWMEGWPELKPLAPLDSGGALRRATPDRAIVTKGGTAAETNRVLRRKTSP